MHQILQEGYSRRKYYSICGLVFSLPLHLRLWKTIQLYCRISCCLPLKQEGSELDGFVFTGSQSPTLWKVLPSSCPQSLPSQDVTLTVSLISLGT